ncbi:hypothetical protein [Streptomyces natalensis]|uniref:hypothetical protein n=1 Tax=Streptomyces natalensis TaxID=68242 RepID=UPI0006911FD2|nr:hypothetical protein [Streptomyces natalensis]
MPDHRISAHDATLVSQAIDRLAPRLTTWTLQTVAQHGQMRFTKITAALPWLSTQNTQQILRRMHANGLLDRTGHSLRSLPWGRNAHSVHRTLASWHRTHAGGSGPAVVEAEHTEDALRQLRGLSGGLIRPLNSWRESQPSRVGNSSASVPTSSAIRPGAVEPGAHPAPTRHVSRAVDLPTTAGSSKEVELGG